MPPWPMAMPSSTAMVLNSRPTPPASAIASATSAPMSLRCTCPGTNWVKLLAMATIGLPKSSSVIPVARHRARAPAMVRPCVEVFDRRSGIPTSFTPSAAAVRGCLDVSQQLRVRVPVEHGDPAELGRASSPGHGDRLDGGRADGDRGDRLAGRLGTSGGALLSGVPDAGGRGPGRGGERAGRAARRRRAGVERAAAGGPGRGGGGGHVARHAAGRGGVPATARRLGLAGGRRPGAARRGDPGHGGLVRRLGTAQSSRRGCSAPPPAGPTARFSVPRW